MRSIRTIYTIGKGPSSSHSMGPANAAGLFIQELDRRDVHIKVSLYGSLAATGKGHLTDQAILEVLGEIPVELQWTPDETLPRHPNGMNFAAYNDQGELLAQKHFYSIGGGHLADDTGPITLQTTKEYPHKSFQDILNFCDRENIQLWQYVDQYDDASIWTHLDRVWQVMQDSVERGLKKEGVLPGCLKLKRRAKSMLENANHRIGFLHERNLLSAYALAVAEENAAGGMIVTAPTCGSCGVIPAVLYYFKCYYGIDMETLKRALAVAGLIGATVVQRASISGAEVGCQGEIGSACSMASGMAAFLLKGSNAQIEYAAEMGLEHFLGLTCDPIAGLVQIPCIERNAFAAMRSMDCAAYALATEGSHWVGLDDVIDVMQDTGRDLQSKYRETAIGGLAAIMKKRNVC